ncbi:MAG: hypothetical protein EBX51_03535 [Acidimicrobiia bacterium]|nr:hypothetical protein [Acidimicrobiia bacterium]
MSDSIGLYLNDIGKVPLLTAEDERVLSKAIEAGRAAEAKAKKGQRNAAIRKDMRDAKRAKDRFIRANLRLVASPSSPIGLSSDTGVVRRCSSAFSAVRPSASPEP